MPASPHTLRRSVAIVVAAALSVVAGARNSSRTGPDLTQGHPLHSLAVGVTSHAAAPAALSRSLVARHVNGQIKESAKLLAVLESVAERPGLFPATTLGPGALASFETLRYASASPRSPPTTL